MKESYTAIALVFIIAALLIMGCTDNMDNPGVTKIEFPAVVKVIWYSENGIPFQYRIQLGVSSPSKEVNFFVGDDGMVFTPDDRIYGYWHSWGEGEDWRGCYKWGTGADLLWFTSDDQYRDYEKQYNSTSDGIYNPDNSLKAYWKDAYDAYHNRIQRIAIRNIGSDLTWFTSDDGPGNDDEWFGGKYYNAEYDNPPPEPVYWFSWSRLVAFGDSGPNLHWFDSDDRAKVCMVHEFTNGGYFCTKEITYDCVDGIAFNEDDVMNSYADYEYFYDNGSTNLTGTWRGIYYDTSESDWGTLVCALIQNNTTITGTATFHSDNMQGDFTGAINGTISGHALAFVCRNASNPSGYIELTAEAYCENTLGYYDYRGSLDWMGKGMISIEKEP